MNSRRSSKTCRVAAILTSEGEKLRVARTGCLSLEPAWPQPAPDFLKLTSGTTSMPRGIRFRVEQLLADGDQVCTTMGITEEDLNFGAIPFSHSYGFSNLLMPLLSCGVPLVATDERLPRALLESWRRTGATVFPGMPVLFERLAELPKVAPFNGHFGGALRLCISAGAPLAAAVARQFHEVYGLKIHTFYGASECGGISYDRSDDLGIEDGGVGTPMDGVAITADGPRQIAVRSAAVGDGYFPEAEPDTLGAGRFVPGDFVEWREGALFITGRSSDVINIAGRKLNPAEIEGRIASFPGVEQVIVFGVPSALRGEEPVACVRGLDLDRAALQRHCQLALSAWQMPRDFWLVSEIPVNERGKLSRRALSEAYRAQRFAPSHDSSIGSRWR